MVSLRKVKSFQEDSDQVNTSEDVLKETDEELLNLYATNDNTSLHPKHMESVHNEKEFACDRSKHKSPSKTLWTKHKESVHKETKFACDKCEYKSPSQC